MARSLRRVPSRRPDGLSGPRPTTCAALPQRPVRRIGGAIRRLPPTTWTHSSIPFEQRSIKAVTTFYYGAENEPTTPKLAVAGR